MIEATKDYDDAIEGIMSDPNGEHKVYIFKAIKEITCVF
jgi:hypothetical protein